VLGIAPLEPVADRIPLEASVPRPKQSAHVYELAKRGAQARLQDLINEVKLLTNLFPDLRESVDAENLPIPFLLKQGSEKAGGRGWTNAQRKAAATRMKAYWAKRKASKKS
jgi:hypothetical protein